ncbi:MAG: aspartate kinase [Ginsengibacter sp.]
MKVFKFGGASISNYERIQNVAAIVRDHEGEPLLIVISAMGKITNALEKVVDAFFEERKEDAFHLFQKVKEHHLTQLKYLVTAQWEKATNELQIIFNEVESLLEQSPVKEYNYYYDQVVSTGELLSSTLLSFYLNEQHLSNQWMDVRNLIHTDSNFRDAKIDWEFSTYSIRETLLPILDNKKFVVTQGFIGRTADNQTTTLGREGSDYTAAVFAKILHAESVTIWKDVEGVMNADPREFDHAVVLHHLSYKEVIEMSYYGAQVIHPKTIKPLQNEKIPLYVKSFLDPDLPGTIINQKYSANLPPMMVYKRNQVLITLQSLDYSFVEGQPVNVLHTILDEIKIKPNLTQNTAISLLICVDDITEKIDEIAIQATEFFDVQIQRNLTLITIRHYTPEMIAEMVSGQQIILEQKTIETIQMVVIEN